MDLRMHDLQDLQILAEKTKPAAHILETVMGELEQRNLELASLLKASEKSRAEMEQMLKEQNEEVTTLRANTVIMRTLEDEVETLNEKKKELLETVFHLETELSQSAKHEQMFNRRLHKLEKEREQSNQDYSLQITDLTNNLACSQEEIREKEKVIEHTELTIKELFEKCNQLSANNVDIKNELMHCLESGKQLKDLNTKLQFCKDYLEQQVDQLIKELKSSKGFNEQLKLEMSNMNREKQNASKQVILLEEQQKQVDSEMKILKDKLSNIQKHVQEYESGDLRSASVLSEIGKEKEAHENTKLALEKKIRSLESQISHQVEELKNTALDGRKMKTELMQVHSKVEYYQQHFIEKQELQKIRSDLEIKYKLDLNTQLQKVSAMFEQEQNELIATMRSSLAQRQEPRYDNDSSPFRLPYRS